MLREQIAVRFSDDAQMRRMPYKIGTYLSSTNTAHEVRTNAVTRGLSELDKRSFLVKSVSRGRLLTGAYNLLTLTASDELVVGERKPCAPVSTLGGVVRGS